MRCSAWSHFHSFWTFAVLRHAVVIPHLLVRHILLRNIYPCRINCNFLLGCTIYYTQILFLLERSSIDVWLISWGPIMKKLDSSFLDNPVVWRDPSNRFIGEYLGLPLIMTMDRHPPSSNGQDLYLPLAAQWYIKPREARQSIMMGEIDPQNRKANLCTRVQLRRKSLLLRPLTTIYSKGMKIQDMW